MKYLLVLLSVCLVSLPVISSDSYIAIPDNTILAQISDNINQDGMQLSVQTFSSKNSVKSVMGFYREEWFVEGDMPGFVENTMGDWSIISQLRTDSNVVLQIRPQDDGSTQGFLSTAKLNHGGTPPTVDFPMPDGIEPFSTSFVEEDDAQILTMTLISKQSIGNTLNYYRSIMSRRGWQIAQDKEVEGHQIMLFNRNGDRCELVVSQLDRESIVIHVNRVKRNG